MGCRPSPPAQRRAWNLVKEMREGDTSHARIAAAKAILDRAVGKPTQLIAGDADEQPVISNEERREQMRTLVAKAFARVVEQNPELAPEEAKMPASSTGIEYRCGVGRAVRS